MKKKPEIIDGESGELGFSDYLVLVELQAEASFFGTTERAEVELFERARESLVFELSSGSLD